MVFQVKNESKIKTFYFNNKMSNACIAAKNEQDAFSVAEKCARSILSFGKTGRVLPRVFGQQKSKQGAAPS